MRLGGAAAATVAVIAIVTSVASPSVAQAKPPTKKLLKKANRYEKKGKKLHKKKKFEQAIVAFDLAYKTAPLPRYLFNIAVCHEQMGDLFTAMEFIERYVDDTEDPAEKEDARQKADLLRGKLQRTSGELIVEARPKGAVVKLDGTRSLVGEAPMRLWLEAGPWKLNVAKDGYDPHTSTVVVAIGDTVKRSVRLVSIAGKELRQAEAEEREVDAKEDAKERADAEVQRKADEEAAAAAEAEAARTRAAATAGEPGLPALAAWGAGTALVLGGALFGLLASTADDDLDAMKAEVHSPSEVKDQYDTAASRQTLAIALTGTGLVVAGVGVALWILQDGPEPIGTGLRWTF